jgi:GNAT superfamily N-acetyltransferase
LDALFFSYFYLYFIHFLFLGIIGVCMLHVRNLTSNDLSLIDLVVQAAYQQPGSRQKALQQYVALQADGWFVAEYNSALAGLVGATVYDAFAYIGMMSVLPSMQRRGIGRALMEHLLLWLEQVHCPVALLDATPAGAALYQHFDFVAVDTVEEWRQASAQRISVVDYPHGWRVDTLSLVDLAQLVTFDAPYFGAERTALFSLLLSEMPQRAFVVRNHRDAITGYLFARDTMLGPWVACDEQTAELLFTYALSLSLATRHVIQIPGANQHALRLVERYGFSRQRVLTHMCRGNDDLSRQRANIYGQASYAWG